MSGSGSLRKLEEPDLADRSSQSSFTSQDGTGKDQLVGGEKANRGVEMQKKPTVSVEFVMVLIVSSVSWLAEEYNEKVKSDKVTAADRENNNPTPRGSKEVREVYLCVLDVITD